jgi:hypothetical protein
MSCGKNKRQQINKLRKKKRKMTILEYARKQKPVSPSIKKRDIR